MRIQRFYTVHGEDAYARVQFRTVDVSQADANGEAGADEIIVPAAWSHIAAEAWYDHGCYRGTVPEQTLPVVEAKTPEWLLRREAPAGQTSHAVTETDCRQVFNRVAGGLTYCGWKNGYFTAAEDAQTFYDELRYLLANGMIALPSSVLQQAGLIWAYGITTTSGNSFGLERGHRPRRAAQTVPNLVRQTDPRAIPQFFQPDEPRFAAWLEGKRDQVTAELALRWGSLALQEQLDGIYNAASSGLSAAAVDKARRLGVPDVLISPVLERAKRQAGRLAIELQPSEAGARRIQDHLLVSRLPDDPELYQALWSYNAPGMLFVQTWQDWDYEAGADTTETDSALRAYRRGTEASRGNLNLFAFLSEHHTGRAFDTIGLTHATKVLILALDLVLQASGYPDEGSAQRSQLTRPLALGYHNLAPCLLALGHAYDSESGRALAAAVAACISGSATVMSAELSQQLGAAGDYERQRKGVLRVLRNRRRAVYGETQDYELQARLPASITLEHCPDLVLLAAARRAWDNALALVQIAGIRNLQLTSLDTESAPQGLLDAATVGLNPLPALTLDRQENDEHFMLQTVPGLGAALETLGYNEAEQKMIRGQLIGTRTLRGAPYINHETLKARGLTEVMLQRAEGALASSSSLYHVVHPWVLGVAHCAEQLGLSPAELDDPHFNLLQKLGYATAEIVAAQAYACGGIPAEQLIGVHTRHRPVFACLDAVGEGTLSPEAILKMAGAVQPFVCGDVGVVVPLPVRSDTDDVVALTQLAQDCGCKSFVIKRAAEQPWSRPLQATITRNVMRQVETTVSSNGRLTRNKPVRVSEGLPRAGVPAYRPAAGEPVAVARLKVRISAGETVVPEAVN